MMHHPDICFLKKHCLPEWKAAIEGNSTMMAFKKGQEIFREGDPVSGFYFIHSGKVKVHKQWGEEKELIIRFSKEGDVLGHRGFGNVQFFPVSATAIEYTSACFITNEFLMTSLKVNPELTYQLMLFFASELQEAERGMRNMVHMDVKSRIAETILKISDTFGSTADGAINSTLTRQEIASYAGTTYETLFKVLNELVAEGLLEIQGKSIRILHADKLHEHIKTG